MQSNLAFITLRCVHCGHATSQQLLFKHEIAYRYVDAEGYSMTEPAMYTGFACELCTELSIYIHSPFHSPESEYGVMVYPERPAEYEYLPKKVASAYAEALSVRRVSRPAFVLMGRRVLEEVAKDQGCSAKSLAESIRRLAVSGKLPPFLAEASTLVRMFGNAAAHESDIELNEHHVNLCDGFLSALMRHLYIDPICLGSIQGFLEIENSSNGAGR